MIEYITITVTDMHGLQAKIQCSKDVFHKVDAMNDEMNIDVRCNGWSLEIPEWEARIAEKEENE